MRNLIPLMFILTIFSCNENDVIPTLDIFNEWEWIMTTFDTRGKIITAQKLDSTYFYTFTKDGLLQMKDNNRELKNQFNFELVEDDPFNRIVIDDLGLTWGYSIKSDTLRLWEPHSIFPRTHIFKKH